MLLLPFISQPKIILNKHFTGNLCFYGCVVVALNVSLLGAVFHTKILNTALMLNLL